MHYENKDPFFKIYFLLVSIYLLPRDLNSWIDITIQCLFLFSFGQISESLAFHKRRVFKESFSVWVYYFWTAQAIKDDPLSDWDRYEIAAASFNKKKEEWEKAGPPADTSQDILSRQLRDYRVFS